MRIFLLVPAVLLSGCLATTPKFPDAPATLTEVCPKLQTIDKTDSVSIVDLTKTTTNNYTTYHECAAKVEGWIEWHKSQKSIWDNVNK